MNIALGLFHFNPHWNLDNRSAHRHCTETLIPFVNAVATNPEWNVSVEISGSGLEFIDRSYPGLMRKFRDLVHSGRIELISSLYTPNIWLAFPRSDLLRSIQLNQRCLAKLDLPWTRIFFAQEGFFGEAVTTLSDFFDIAVCRDDYLAYYYSLSFERPCFVRNGVKIIAASSHLLNEFTRELGADTDFVARNGLSPIHKQYLESSYTLNDPANFPGAAGEFSGLRWLWYHCGDGNHFGAIHKPDDLEHCYYDPVWCALCTRQILSYRARGYKLSTIREFVDALDWSEAVQLPPLIDGCWNPRIAEGLMCWMGRNATVWENDATVLAATARARARLIAAERAVDTLGSATETSKVDGAWAALLHAQISDALGWSAGGQAVQLALNTASHVAMTANQILDSVGCYDFYEPGFYKLPALCRNLDDIEPVAWPRPELFGAEGLPACELINHDVCLCECRFKSTETRCGLRFPLATAELEFCPAAMEHSPISMPISSLRPHSITLPLPNGMLKIAKDLYIVKDTQSVHVCATIDVATNTVAFAIDGAQLNQYMTWRFYFIAGPLEYALVCANIINCIDQSAPDVMVWTRPSD